MNETADYYRTQIEDQHTLLGALCFARGYTQSAAESITKQWDELSKTNRGRAELRARLDRLIAVLSIPADGLVAWERSKTAECRREVDRG